MSDTSQGDGWWLASDGKWYPPQSRPAPPPPPLPPPTPSAAASDPIWPTDRKVALGASVMIVVGALLPWASVSTGFGTISKAGVDGDGIITLVLGIITVITVIDGKRKNMNGGAVVAGIVAAIGVWDASQIVNNSDSVTIGAGLWITIVAALLTLFAIVALPKLER